MDSSSVLLALDEQKKWRERRKRIRDRLRMLERRKTTLRKELEGVRKKILEYNRLLTDLRDRMPTRAVLPPSARGDDDDPRVGSDSKGNRTVAAPGEAPPRRPPGRR